MSYPRKLLSADEVIEAEFRPHWSGLLKEGLIVLAGIAAAVLLSFLDVSGWVYAILAGLVILLTVRGVIRWLTTLHQGWYQHPRRVDCLTVGSTLQVA